MTTERSHEPFEYNTNAAINFRKLRIEGIGHILHTVEFAIHGNETIIAVRESGAISQKVSTGLRCPENNNSL